MGNEGNVLLTLNSISDTIDRMRNRIAHGYLELDAELILEAIKIGIPPPKEAIADAIRLIKSENYFLNYNVHAHSLHINMENHN